MATDSPTLYARWLLQEARGQLSFWGELWAPPESLPEYEAWVQLSRRRGVSLGPDELKYHMTRGLLREVVYAAGAVESELDRLCAALIDAQAWTDQALLAHSSAGEVAPNTYSGAPSLHEAFYAFINMLTWARAVCERTSRDSKRSGLLPALAAGKLRDQVGAAHSRLIRDLAEVRHMANYALHAGAIPGGGTPSARIMPGGGLAIPLPDRLGHRITTWEEFDFSEGRDMLSFARNVMTAVEVFVDDVLSAFEAARPARAGPLPPPL
jgi:hypothetical protein